MNQLMLKIKTEIDLKIEKFEKLSTETVYVFLTLNEKEVKEFKKMNFNRHYICELIENDLYIDYVEELKI